MALIHSIITSATYLIKVATPVITPASGDLDVPVTCTITCATEGATIMYTTDLSTPTPTHGTEYTGPFTLTDSTVQVKAMAYKESLTDSDTATNDWLWVDEPSWNPSNPSYAAPGIPTLITIDDGVGPFTWTADAGYFASETTESGSNYYYGAGGMACSYEYIYITDYWGVTVTGTMYGICGNDDEEIGYTTLQMSFNESQNLTVVASGTTLSGCADEYTWSITQGGGSLSTTSGTSTTYTAPATNENCEDNPTITLYACGREVDTLQLAVTRTTGRCNTSSYYAYAVCRGMCKFQAFSGEYIYCYDTYDCYGDVNTTCFAEYGSSCTLANCSAEGVVLEGYEGGGYNLTSRSNAYWDCGCGGTTYVANVLDNRSATDLANGCCPWAAL